jgi:hypothetical protein
MAPIDSLERCIGSLRIHEVKADRPGFRGFGPQAMPNGFPGVFRNQFLEIRLGAFMLLMGSAGPAIYGRQFRPAIGPAHVHDADGFESRAGWLDAEQARGLAALNNGGSPIVYTRRVPSSGVHSRDFC